MNLFSFLRFIGGVVFVIFSTNAWSGLRDMSSWDELLGDYEWQRKDGSTATARFSKSYFAIFQNKVEGHLYCINGDGIPKDEFCFFELKKEKYLYMFFLPIPRFNPQTGNPLTMEEKLEADLLEPSNCPFTRVTSESKKNIYMDFCGDGDVVNEITVLDIDSLELLAYDTQQDFLIRSPFRSLVFSAKLKRKVTPK